VQRAACGVRRAACGVRRAACGVRRAACGLQRAACGVRRCRPGGLGPGLYEAAHGRVEDAVLGGERRELVAKCGVDGREADTAAHAQQAAGEGVERDPELVGSRLRRGGARGSRGTLGGARACRRR
jgi:hypothetical protein